jgi:alpha-galactosidase
MAFRGAVALPGHLGVELDVRRLGAGQRAELQGWIALYKRLRCHLHQGRVWLGDAQDGVVWQAHGDAAASELLLLAYRSQPSSLRYPPAIRLAMLDATARYRVTLVTPDHLPEEALYQGSAPHFEALRAPEGVLLDGAWLVHAGMPLPRSRSETAFIVRLRRV